MINQAEELQVEQANKDRYPKHIRRSNAPKPIEGLRRQVLRIRMGGDKHLSETKTGGPHTRKPPDMYIGNYVVLPQQRLSSGALASA